MAWKLTFTEIECEFLKFVLISQSVNGIVILQSVNVNNLNNNNNLMVIIIMIITMA